MSMPKNQTEFDWAFGLNRLTLGLMGVWPDKEANIQQSSTVLLRIPFMILVIFVFLILPQTYALILVIHELPLVVDNLITNWASLVSCMKLFFMWRSKKRTFFKPANHFLPMYTCILFNSLEDWHRRKSNWETETMRRQAFRGRVFTISGYAIMLGAYSGFAFAPLFGFKMRTITNTTDYGGRYLSVQAAYPYDYSRSPVFEIMEFSQIFAGFFLAMSLSIPDNYFGALVFHSCAQFEILGYQIQNFQRDVDQSKDSNMDFGKKFRTFCDRHVQLLLIAATLEKSFCFIIAATVLSTSVMLVCFGFQVQDLLNSTTDKSSLIRLLTLLASLSTLLLHTFVDCFASETLITYNTGIFYNIYTSKWYLIQNHNSRNIIPMMIVAGKTKPLTAGKIFNLTLQSYCDLIKTSAGYISMLVAVNGR